MSNPLRQAARRMRPPVESSKPAATAFRGAVNNRFTEDWILASIRSADAELRGDLRTLRKRTRELARNTPHCHRFLGLLADNIVGPHGIRLQSRPLRHDGEVDEDAAKKIEAAWLEWGDPETCSADGRNSWRGIEELTVMSEAQDGEGLVRMLPGFKNKFGFAVQLLDPDQLDEEYNRPRSERKNEIRMGVEVDQWGRPVRYHLWDAHPFDYQGSHRRKRIEISAQQLIHRYEIRRIGQTRGVSWFAPVLMDSQMLQALQEAELIASRMSASKGGVLYLDGEAVGDIDMPENLEGLDWQLEPGIWEMLPPGVRAELFDPQHPNSAFAEFNKIILHTIAAGLGTSYSSLTGDLSKVSFSSIRAGTLQERDIYRRLQERTYTHLHTRVFRVWLRWALSMGAIDLPLREYDRLVRHTWQPRRWDWVDPVKDLRAAQISLELGLDSRTRLAAEQGRDFAEIIEERKREDRLLGRVGVELGSNPGRAGAIARALQDADDDELATAFSMLNGHGSRIAGLLNGVAHADH